MPSVTEAADHAQHTGGQGLACCPERDMRFVGYVSSATQRRVACDRPVRFVCECCGHSEQWTCNCSDARKCLQCSDRNRRRFMRVIEQGLSSGSGYAYFLTVTAPGEAPHRQWVQGKVRHRPECSCWDHGMTLGAWNAQEAACWNRLRTSLARLVDGFAYAGAVEKQERGALHRHVVIRTDEPLLPGQVQALAMAAGYGCVFDLDACHSDRDLARYVTKKLASYVTKSGDRHEVPWERVGCNHWECRERADRDSGEIPPCEIATYRLRSQSQSWGVSMKDLRAAASLQARARAAALRELAQQLDPPQVVPVVASTGSDPPT